MKKKPPVFEHGIKLNVFFERRPAALVVSHERSGTHFLMNTLAACYGYVSNPWINLDHDSARINFFLPASVTEFLLSVAAQPVANTVKSHHQAEFFRGELDNISQRYAILVVVRDPVDMLVSFWRFLHYWPWFEGPRTPDPVALARSEPSGGLMRYQTRQHPTMMHRWAAHAEGWLAAEQACARVKVVRYEDLSADYEQTVRSFAPLLERQPLRLVRPARDRSVVEGGGGDPTGLGVAPDPEALRRVCRQTVGDTMARLGY
jgi:hypothetical protein